MGLIEFSTYLGVPQSSVWSWEKGTRPITVAGLLKIAARAAPEDRDFWLSAAGINPIAVPIEKDTRHIPVLRDAAACGTPRAVDEREIESTISFPSRWLPSGGSIEAIKVVGDSMSPLLEDGFIALVDVASRDVLRLVGKMVLARDGDGVTIKWFRKQEAMFLLVPQNPSPRNQVQVWTTSDNRAIVGEVVRWIGFPPQHPKRK
jgi:SOS-response transcriptional repressor LexA